MSRPGQSVVALGWSEKPASTAAAVVVATMLSIHRFCCVVQLLLQYVFAASEVGGGGVGDVLAGARDEIVGGGKEVAECVCGSVGLLVLCC